MRKVLGWVVAVAVLCALGGYIVWGGSSSHAPAQASASASATTGTPTASPTSSHSHSTATSKSVTSQPTCKRTTVKIKSPVNGTYIPDGRKGVQLRGTACLQLGHTVWAFDSTDQGVYTFKKLLLGFLYATLSKCISVPMNCLSRSS